MEGPLWECQPLTFCSDGIQGLVPELARSNRGHWTKGSVNSENAWISSELFPKMPMQATVGPAHAQPPAGLATSPPTQLDWFTSTTSW